MQSEKEKIATKDGLKGLEISLEDRLVSVALDDWRRLFRSYPDSPSVINLIDEIGLDGFEFRSIVVTENSRPILLLPLFVTHYDVSVTTASKQPRWLEILKAVAPWITTPKLLSVGFVESEWGDFGIDPDASSDRVAEAFKLAFERLSRLAAEIDAQIIGFKDFRVAVDQLLPASLLEDFQTVTSLPYAQMDVHFSSVEEYWETIGPKMKRYLRSCLRKSENVEILRTNDVAPYVERIHELYLLQLSNSEMQFGSHKIAFFERAASEVPGAFYNLYFVEGRLIGFELMIAESQSAGGRPDVLILKYIGIDPELGRQHKLYFRAWMESIKFAIAHKIPLIHAGATEEELKSRLGMRLVPTFLTYKHRNPALNWLFRTLQDRVAYKSEVDLKPKEERRGSSVGSPKHMVVLRLLPALFGWFLLRFFGLAKYRSSGQSSNK